MANLVTNSASSSTDQKSIGDENETPNFPPAPCYAIPKTLFFYGTLTDPSILQEVLQLPILPVLRPARVRGAKIMLWGQFPALIEVRSKDSYVDGMAYTVETEQHLKMLRAYEPRAYSYHFTRIDIDGESVRGKVYRWANRNNRSQLTEGTWSLEEWKKKVEADHRISLKSKGE